MKPILTIAIPTWNRVSYLRELLPEIISQCKEFPREIEILVSDNCSTDNTPRYIIDARKYLADPSGVSLHYYRNCVNIGGDRNFIKCVSCAKGDYVWLFGDDDQIVHGAIALVMSTLKKGNVDLIIVGDEAYNVGIPESTTFGSYKDVVRTMGWANPHFVLAHTLITANIFKQSIFDIEFATSMLKSTCYSHMYTLMKSLVVGGRVTVLVEPIVNTTRNHASFGEAQPLLYLHQFNYIRHIGSIFENRAVSKYAYKFIVKSLPQAGYNFLMELKPR